MGHRWLVGMMGSGKTVAGRVLAARTGSPFYDLDDEVESDVGRSASSIFRDDGEERFRSYESVALERVAGQAPGVVATGGGSVLRERNVALMRATGTVVLLRAASSVLAGRLADDTGRPLLADSSDPAAILAGLAAERNEAYLSAADVIVESDGRSPEEVAIAIEAACGAI